MNKTNIIITGEDFDYSFDKLKAMEVNIFHYPMIFTSGIDVNIDPNTQEISFILGNPIILPDLHAFQDSDR